MADSSTPTVKVSCHMQVAKDTARHNDRSMYKDGYENRKRNQHFDIYGMGSGHSHDAEVLWYEHTFRKVLDKTNENYKKQGHPERCKTMKEYRQAHMPQEMILQIGTHTDYENGLIDETYLEQVIPLIVDEIEKSGGTVLSWDLHMDECEDKDNWKADVSTAEKDLSVREGSRVQGTPHLHLRFAMVDSKGKMSVPSTLKEHGIEPPIPDMEEYRKHLIEIEMNDETITEKKRKSNIEKIKKKSVKVLRQGNNEKMTFTDNVRYVAEQFAHQWCGERGLNLDDENRSNRPHLEPKPFREQKTIKSLMAKNQELQSKLDEAEQKLEEANQVYEEKYQEGLDKVASLHDLAVRGLEERIPEWKADAKRDIDEELATYRQSEIAKVDEEVAIERTNINKQLDEKKEELASVQSQVDDAWTDFDKQIEEWNKIIEDIETSSDMTEPWDNFVEAMQKTNWINTMPPVVRQSFDVVQQARKRHPFQDALKSAIRAVKSIAQVVRAKVNRDNLDYPIQTENENNFGL